MESQKLHGFRNTDNMMGGRERGELSDRQLYTQRIVPYEERELTVASS